MKILINAIIIATLLITVIHCGSDTPNDNCSSIHGHDIVFYHGKWYKRKRRTPTPVPTLIPTLVGTTVPGVTPTVTPVAIPIVLENELEDLEEVEICERTNL